MPNGIWICIAWYRISVQKYGFLHKRMTTAIKRVLDDLCFGWSLVFDNHFLGYHDHFFSYEMTSHRLLSVWRNSFCWVVTLERFYCIWNAGLKAWSLKTGSPVYEILDKMQWQRYRLNTAVYAGIISYLFPIFHMPNIWVQYLSCLLLFYVNYCGVPFVSNVDTSKQPFQFHFVCIYV